MRKHSSRTRCGRGVCRWEKGDNGMGSGRGEDGWGRWSSTDCATCIDRNGAGMTYPEKVDNI